MSYSMSRPMGKISRMEAARIAFNEALKDIPDNSMLALRVFAQKGDKDSVAACQETELIVPFQQGAKQQILKFIQQAKPIGTQTPLINTLEVALDDFKNIQGSKKIILLSDGEETCLTDMDPVMSQYKQADMPVDTIGIGDEVPFTWLGDIALESGGMFFNGANLEGLKNALRQTMTKKRVSLPGAPTGEKTKEISLPPKPEFSDKSPSSMIKVIAVPSEAKEGKTAPPPEEEMERPEEMEALLTLEIIIDSSGSMQEKIGNETKMDMAKNALEEVLVPLNHPSIALGLRAFGYDTSIDNQNKELSCKNSELLVPFARKNTETVGKAARKLTPWGFTPIALSLELAGEDLKPFIENKPTIILISDGKETCGGDPVAVINHLKEMGIDVKVHVIGFDLDSESREQLMAIAEAGGGQYYDATDYRSLVESLDKLVSEMKGEVLEEERQRFISPIEGGKDFSSAVTISPGKYTLAKNLPKGVEVFFHVPSKKGQRTIIRSEVQSYILVRDREGGYVESDLIGSGVMVNIYRPNKKKIKGRGSLLRGEIGEWVTTHYMDTTGEGFYFTIGDAYKPVQKDIIFEVTIQEAGDVYEGLIAPETLNEEPLVININEKITAHMGLEDRKDTFLIDKPFPQGERLSIAVKFAEPGFKFKVEVYNKDKKRLKRFIKLEQKAKLEVNIPKAIDGLFIRITDNNPILYHIFSSYEIKVEEE